MRNAVLEAKDYIPVTATCESFEKIDVKEESNPYLVAIGQLKGGSGQEVNGRLT